MLSAWDVFLGVVLPAVLVMAAYLAAWRPWRREALETRRGGWAAGTVPLAFGLAYYLVLFWRMGAVPQWPPVDTTHYLLFMALPLTVLAAVDGMLLREDTPWRWHGLLALGRLLLGIVLALAFVRWLLRPTIEFAWLGDETFVGVFAVAIAAAWVSLGLLTDRARGVAVPLALTVALGATGAALLLSGSQKFGQLGGALAAAVGGAMLAAIWVRRAHVAAGLGSPVAFLQIGLLLTGYYFASLTMVNALLLGMAPHGAWLGDLPWVRTWPGWTRVVVRVATVGLPAGVAVALAVQKFMADLAADPMGY